MSVDTRCVITCAEPGCKEHIHYFTEDTEVPLYCWKHRSVSGRHSQTRNLVKPVKEPEPEKLIIFRCINRTCNHRVTVTKSDWMNGKVPTCSECSGKMIYHKDEGK